MPQIQYDSMRVPYSWVRSGVRWQGQYVLLIPMNAEGGLLPYMESIAGFRNRTGRAVHFDRSKYMPHQGKKERLRRTSTNVGHMLRDYDFLQEVLADDGS